MPNEPVDVRDVSRAPVPMLRAFRWVATTLQSFRERPLPGSYQTDAIPTFDLFAASRIEEMSFESAAGGVGNLEAYFSQCPEDKWRQYVSVAFQHDDPGGPHVMQACRALSVGGTFPFAPLADPVRGGAAPNGEWFAVRNVSCPPGGRVGAMIDALGVGTQLFLRGVFIEMDVGEPFSSIT